MPVYAHGPPVPVATIAVEKSENQFVELMEEPILIDVCYKLKFAGMISTQSILNWNFFIELNLFHPYFLTYVLKMNALLNPNPQLT